LISSKGKPRGLSALQNLKERAVHHQEIARLQHKTPVAAPPEFLEQFLEVQAQVKIRPSVDLDKDHLIAHRHHQFCQGFAHSTIVEISRRAPR
jgi:hypothetical protein